MTTTDYTVTAADYIRLVNAACDRSRTVPSVEPFAKSGKFAVVNYAFGNVVPHTRRDLIVVDSEEHALAIVEALRC